MPTRVRPINHHRNAATAMPTTMIARRERGVGHARQDLDLTGQPVGRVEEDRQRPPQDADQLVEEQDQAEGRQHLVQVVASVASVRSATQFHHQPEPAPPPAPPATTARRKLSSQAV